MPIILIQSYLEHILDEIDLVISVEIQNDDNYQALNRMLFEYMTYETYEVFLIKQFLRGNGACFNNNHVSQWGYIIKTHNPDI